MFGFPAILNIAVGWWPDPILGARVSGMYYGKAFSGIQGGLCFTLHRGARSRLAATFVVGTLRDEHESWTYVGPGLDSHLGPFLAEVVIGRGSGDLWNFRSVVPAYAFQLGLMGGGGILGPRAK